MANAPFLRSMVVGWSNQDPKFELITVHVDPELAQETVRAFGCMGWETVAEGREVVGWSGGGSLKGDVTPNVVWAGASFSGTSTMSLAAQYGSNLSMRRPKALKKSPEFLRHETNLLDVAFPQPLGFFDWVFVVFCYVTLVLIPLGVWYAASRKKKIAAAEKMFRDSWNGAASELQRLNPSYQL